MNAGSSRHLRTASLRVKPAFSDLTRPVSRWIGRSRSPLAQGRKPLLVILGLAAAVAATTLCGCSSDAAKPRVGSIQVTNANGAKQAGVRSLTVGSGAYFEVVVNHDNQDLGANWSVACGSALPPGSPLPPGQTEDDSCGTFTPAHTQSGPVPTYATSGSGYVTFYTAPAAPPKTGTVTLYASATSDPSTYTSLTLAITGLPISIEFAPAPPSALAVDGTVDLTAVLANDYSNKGAKWKVQCGSSACGSFSSALTASGKATKYTAPGSVPAGGTVTVTATSVTDPTKFVSATVAVDPIEVSVTPPLLQVTTGATGRFNATVSNDVLNRGVNWAVGCGSPNACGSITAHTASGVAATYTAPTTVPKGGSVTVTARSASDAAVSAAATATIVSATGTTVRGKVLSGFEPVQDAAVSLYAAGESGIGSASVLLNPDATATTDTNGGFTLTGEVSCPTFASQLYLIARGGTGAGVTTSNLAFMTAIGSCGRINSAEHVTLNEATTVVSVYALSGFMTDETHIGADGARSVGMANAFAEVPHLVDMQTGIVRLATPNGAGEVSQARINTLANIVHRCITTPGKSTEGAKLCGTQSTTAAEPITTDTIHGVLSIARNAAGISGLVGDVRAFYLLADANGPYQPALEEEPVDRTIGVSFDLSKVGGLEGIAIDRSSNAWIAAGSSVVEVGNIGEGAQQIRFTDPAVTDAKAIAIDAAGFIWVLNRDGSVAGLNGRDGSFIATDQAPRRVGTSPVTALDGSGNLWVLDRKNSTVRVLLGIGTPVAVSTAGHGKDSVAE